MSVTETSTNSEMTQTECQRNGPRFEYLIGFTVAMYSCYSYVFHWDNLVIMDFWRVGSSVYKVS